jgi:hypothetical protein
MIHIRKRNQLMTFKDAALDRLKSYEEEVRSGRHVPPPLPAEVRAETGLVDFRDLLK